MAIERPTIKCLNDCSRIISILSENEAVAAMTAAAVLRDHTNAVVEAKKLGASMAALEWIEKRYNEGNSGEADSCAAMDCWLCCAVIKT